MLRRIARIPTGILALAVFGACVDNKKEVVAAKGATYDADFDVVFQAALDGTRHRYESTTAKKESATIETDWHKVEQTVRWDRGGRFVTGYFIRFDVRVTGGRPWHVDVVAHGGRMEQQSTVMTELRGAEIPGWVGLRADRLRVEIYRRIEKYVVPSSGTHQVR